MSTRCLVNGEAGGCIDPADRGLAYGDGLFETVLLSDGKAPLWLRHMSRLEAGCERLQLPMPDAEWLWRDVQTVTAGLARAVVRISVTRGTGPRGYAPPQAPRPLRIVTASAAPEPVADWYARGIRVRFCRMRLAEQPALAGLKHLNRLEQVLARAEWREPDVVEGLLQDTAGRVVCATAANLFAVIDGVLCTPALTRCGVAGVARAELLAQVPEARVDDFTLEEWMRAEEMFLSSSVRGIVPIHALGEHVLDVGPHTRRWQAYWAQVVPGAGVSA